MSIFGDWTPSGISENQTTPKKEDVPASTPAASQSLSYLSNVGRAIDDYLTFGYGDQLRALMPKAPSLASLRAGTAQAHENLGWLDPVVGAGTAMVGGGAKLPALAADYTRSALQATPRLAKAAGWGAGAAAAGAQGAGEAALGTLGHGGSTEDAMTSAEWGGALGTLLGATGVGSTIKESPVPGSSTIFKSTPTTEALKQAKSDLYDEAGQIQHDYGDVLGVTNAARTAIRAAPPRVEEFGKGALTELGALEKSALANGQVSSERIGDTLKALYQKKTGDMVPDAGQIAQSHLQNFLDTGPSSRGPGAGGPAMAAADEAHQAYKNSVLLDKMRNTPSEAETLAKSALGKKQQFYSPDQQEALRGIQNATSGLPNYFMLKHTIGYPIAGALAGGAFGAGHGAYNTQSGENPWGRALEEMLVYGGGGALAGAVGGGAMNQLAGRAIKRATPTLIQGAPYLPQQPIREGFRAYLNSLGAGGAGY